MDFKDVIKQLSERVDKLKNNLQTEEATKNALIMPFLQALGYDVFNPMEVMPEFTCDIGTKKGEKIDYAILKDDKPIILVECKHWAQDLTLHDNQLLRYYHVSNAKFGILTNGIVYNYTDLENPNKMDEKPFLDINITDIKTNQLEELKKFHKAYFDIDLILSSASELKYTSELKLVINNEFNNPSPEFVKLFAKRVYDGVITAKVQDQFAPLVKKSISNLISDTISDRLKTALDAETKTQSTDQTVAVDAEVDNGKVITIEDEIQAYYIVKSILRPFIDSERVFYRDAQSYFTIIVDDNNRKPICRLYLHNPLSRQISFIGDDKKEIKHKINTLDDIYSYSSELINAIEKYSSECD